MHSCVVNNIFIICTSFLNVTLNFPITHINSKVKQIIDLKRNYLYIYRRFKWKFKYSMWKSTCRRNINNEYTTASSTTRLSSPTTVVLSTEPISAFNITDANINTTAAPLSAEGICGHQIYAKCKYIHVYFLSGLRWHCSEAMDVGRQCVDVNIHSLAAKVNKKPNILKEKTPL